NGQALLYLAGERQHFFRLWSDRPVHVLRQSDDDARRLEGREDRTQGVQICRELGAVDDVDALRGPAMLVRDRDADAPIADIESADAHQTCLTVGWGPRNA